METGIDKPEVVLSDYVIDYTRLNIDQRVLVKSETDGYDFRYTYGLDLVNVKATGEGTNWWAQSVKKCVYSDYVHTDRLGSVVNLTDQYGRVPAQVDYDDWGKVTAYQSLNISGGYRRVLPEITYAGHQYDDVLNMFYAKARMYDAENRRSASVDPVKGNITNPMTMVQYLYVVDDPLGWVDPLGLRVTVPDAPGGGTSNDSAKTPEVTQNSNDENIPIYLPNQRDDDWFPLLLPDAFMFKRDITQRIWYSDTDTWQKYFGYNDLYDFAFQVVDYSYFLSEFEHMGHKWRIEGWKGNYLNMGVGAEIGIYYQENPLTSEITVNNDQFITGLDNQAAIAGAYMGKFICEEHYTVPPIEYWGNMTVQFSLYVQNMDTKEKQLIFTREEQSHWWLNGFRPDIGPIPSKQLLLIGSITFLDSEMARKFVRNVKGDEGVQSIVVNWNEYSYSAKVNLYWEGGK